MKRSLLALLILLAASAPCSADAPSSPAEWNQMYEACVEGVSKIAPSIRLPSGGAQATCACIRDRLQRVPRSEMDQRFPQIRDECLGKVKANSAAQGYPEAGITNLRATCMQRQALPNRCGQPTGTVTSI